MSLFGPPNVRKLLAKGDLEGLVKALTNAHQGTRVEAARALGALGNPAAVPALLRLTGRASRTQRGKTPQPVPQRDEPAVHAAAIEALGALIASSGVSDTDPALRAIVEDAAGGQQAGFAPIMTSDSDFQRLMTDELVRESARRMLASLSEQYSADIGHAILFLRDPGDLPNHPNPYQWHHGQLLEELIRSLGEVGAKVLLDGGGLYRHGHYGYVCADLRLTGSAALRPAFAALRSPEPQTRELAARVLGYLHEAEAIQPLVEALDDTDPIVREAAADALLKLGWKAHDDAEQARYDVARIRLMPSKEMCHLGPSAVEPLVRCLRDSVVEPLLDETQRAMVGVTFVENQRRHDRVNGSGAWQAKPKAAEALGHLGDRRGVNPLIDALRDPDLRVRRAAAEALGRLADRRAIEPLTTACEHTVDPQLDEIAHESLRKLRGMPREKSSASV